MAPGLTFDCCTDERDRASLFTEFNCRHACKLQQRSQPTTPLRNDMSVSNSPSLIERLPIELLERIFLLTSAQDILRLSSVRNITEVTQIRVFAECRNFERSITLSMVSSGLLLLSNTISTSLVPGCNITHGRKNPWLIAARLLKRTARGGRHWILPKSGTRFSTTCPASERLPS